MSRIGNWALLGVVALMSVALVATVYSTSRGISEASDTLTRGQSSVFRGMVRRLSRGEASEAQLAELLEQQRSNGLRYLAVLASDGSVMAQAGARTAPDQPLLERDRRFGRRDLDGLIRLQMLPPPDRTGNTVVLDFEPIIADQLERDASRSLTIAIIVGVVLLAFSGMLLRWYLRQRKLEAQMTENRRLAALGEMSATLAHEIRNPIASLKGNAQLLARMLPEADKSRGKAERVVSEAIRLEMLTNDLLEFARSGAIDRKPTSPAALLADVAEHVERPFEIDTGLAPKSWSLDADRIAQVLRNLIDNAVEAQSESDSPVEVSIARDANVLVMRVRDHGPGVPAGERDSIFAPFATGKTSGTGLGLAVAKRIANLHGGDIAVEDAAGGGAVFVVTIPGEVS